MIKAVGPECSVNFPKCCMYVLYKRNIAVNYLEFLLSLFSNNDPRLVESHNYVEITIRNY